MVQEETQAQQDTEQETIIATNDPIPEESFEVSRVTFNYAIIALVFLLVGGVVGFFIGDQQAATTEDAINQAVDRARQAMGEEVAAALENFEGSGGGGGAQQAESLDPEGRYEVTYEGQPAMGPEDAPVTMIEFSDFRCPYCGRYTAEIFPQLVEEYGDRVRFIYRDYPIIGGQTSYQAALAAECANDQGAFWPFHDALFENQQQISEDLFFQLAEDNGLDMETFTTCFEEDTHRSKILEDFQAGRDLSITGTPTFFVNGRPIIGAQPYAEFAQVIDEELAAAANSSSGDAEDEDLPQVDEDTAS